MFRDVVVKGKNGPSSQQLVWTNGEPEGRGGTYLSTTGLFYY
jgi:hypothetical protein